MFAIFEVLLFFLLSFHDLHPCQALKYYRFELKEERCTKLCNTKLCSTKNIIVVNGQFSGPTIHVQKGDTIIVDVINNGNYNVTLHWHGVGMARNLWSDGPAYITQCPIPPGGKFSQKVIFTVEEGTLWWHAHSNWTRATVYGALIVHPKQAANYPFPKPHAEVPIILGECWKTDIQALFDTFLKKGGHPQISDAYLINGHPGDLYPCSIQDMFKLRVDQGKTYLLRIINSAMQHIMFFGVANHTLTIVGSDGSYLKPFASDYIVISPGQTIDVLLKANQTPSQYYMAAKPYASRPKAVFSKTIATGIIYYNGDYDTNITTPLPNLPDHNNTSAFVTFTNSFRSLASKDHPVEIPLDFKTHLFYTLSMNSFPCEIWSSCDGFNNTRFAASLNNVSFVSPSFDLLEAYYYYNMDHKHFSTNFPDNAPLEFNYTARNLPMEFRVPERGTKVKVLDYNATVEIVFQDTEVLASADHPIHLHGYNYYVVGSGFGNFNKEKDPLNYNLVDPPYLNTVAVPYNGWTAIRFRADNPALSIHTSCIMQIETILYFGNFGVWFMHCHLERHASWGMEMAFIVKDGNTPESSILPPPSDMPRC